MLHMYHFILFIKWLTKKKIDHIRAGSSAIITLYSFVSYYIIFPA